jgi:hypothetical protein
MLYRYWRGEVRSLRIFIDQSSVEIFINDGEGDEQPLFPDYPAQLIQRRDAGNILLLAAATMHGRISVLLSGSWRRDENQTRNH